MAKATNSKGDVKRRLPKNAKGRNRKINGVSPIRAAREDKDLPAHRRSTFVDQDMLKLHKALQGQKLSEVSKDCGVAPATMRSWNGNRTKRPTAATMRAVALSLGLKFGLHK